MLKENNNSAKLSINNSLKKLYDVLPGWSLTIETLCGIVRSLQYFGVVGVPFLKHCAI